MKKVFYYTDLLEDDFAGNDIQRQPLPEDFSYRIEGPLQRGAAFFLHHFIATPIVFAVQKLYYREKIVNRRCIRPYLGEGVYLYGNHTRSAGDAFAPHLVTFPYKSYIVVGAETFSLPGLRWIVKALGAVPLPQTMVQTRAFSGALRSFAEEGAPVAIYPEAHIWPYYTQIRPFADASFAYPVRYEKPAFAFTATYQKTAFRRRPRTTLYVDGPFFADPTLSPGQQRKELRDRVYAAMCARAEASSFAYVAYYPAEKSRD